MPGRQRAPQTATPQTKPAQSTAPKAGDQAAMGNGAISEMLGLSQDGPGGIEGAQSALREKTDGASVSVGGQLPGGMLLGEKDGNKIATGKSTGFTTGVSREGIYAHFSPPIEVTPGSWWERAATGGVTISSIFYSFATGKARVTLDTGVAGDILDFFMDLKEDIEGKFSDGIRSAMPARLQKPGYDPYTDPDLAGLLGNLASTMGSAFPQDGAKKGPGMADKITSPTLSASVRPKPIVIPLQGKIKLHVDPGSSIELAAHLEGSFGTAMKNPKVKSLDLNTQNVSIEHDVAGKIANVGLRRLTLGSDLSVQALDYDLGIESTLSALKLLIVLAELRTGQDMGVRDTNNVQLDSIRKMIDEQAGTKIPELLREQIRANDNAIPGFKLTSMFKV